MGLLEPHEGGGSRWAAVLKQRRKQPLVEELVAADARLRDASDAFLLAANPFPFGSDDDADADDGEAGEEGEEGEEDEDEESDDDDVEVEDIDG